MLAAEAVIRWPDRLGRSISGMRQRLGAFVRIVPVVHEPRKLSIWGVRALLATPCSWFAARMSAISSHRGAYYPDSLPFVFHYPLAAVTLSVVLMVAEVLTLDAVLNRGRSLPVWTRALPAAILALPVSYSAATSSMHAPPYAGIHQIWLVVLNALLAALALASGITDAGRLALARRSPAIGGGRHV